MSLDRELLQSIIKFAYENKEARSYLMPVIKSNYKVAFEKMPLNKLEKWHSEKYGSIKYPSLLIQGKSVGFGTYINYYKKGDVYLKSGSEKVIKKAYDEYQKDHMRIPLREMVKVAYANEDMRSVILGILKKAYAEEEEAVNKGFIPPKTWELMIEWHKKKKGNIKYPSLKQEGQEVAFSTYQGYYNSGDNTLKADAVKLVQKLYDEFKKDLDQAREQSESAAESKYEKEKSTLERRKDLGDEELEKKKKELQEKRVERRVDTVMDFMERCVSEIDGEYVVQKLKDIGEDEKKVLENAQVKLKDIISSRMNNVQDYQEYEGLKKAQESILETVLGKSKAFAESKERLLNGVIRTVEWTTIATNKNGIDKDLEIALNTFFDTDPSQKDKAIDDEYNKGNLNRKFIDDVEIKMFDTLSEKTESIKRERENLRKLQRGESVGYSESEIKSRIHRLKNEISIKENYILNDVTKDIKRKLEDPNISKEEKEESALILKALNQESHLFMKGDTFSLNLPNSDKKVEFNLKETFLKKKELEKEELKKDLEDMFDLVQQVKSGHSSANKQIDKIKAKLVSGLNDKQTENGAFELEEMFDILTFGKLPTISNKISELDTYLDDKYQKGLNQDLRDSMHKTSKVLMSKIKKQFTKETVTNTASSGSPEQVIQDQISYEMNQEISDRIEENRESIFKALKIKAEELPKKDLLVKALQVSATGASEKPINDFLGETVPGFVLDTANDIIKFIADEASKGSVVRDGIELYLREHLKDNNSPIDVLIEKAQDTDFFNEAVNHLKDSNNIGEYMSFLIKGTKILSYDLPDAVNKVSDAIGFGEGGFFENLGENETVDFVGDMLGNAAGGILKSVGMYAAGEWIGNQFQDEFLNLYGGQDRLVQELLAGEKVPKEEENKYQKRLQQIEDSFLTDEQWEEKYRGKTYTVQVEEKGKLWGTNIVEKEVPYKKEDRGRLKKEATQKAKDVIKEGSPIYETLNSIPKYQSMVKELKEGNLRILSKVDKTQLNKIKEELKAKNIDKDTIGLFEDLYEKTSKADEEGHGVYNPSYSRENAIKDMVEVYKEYETHAKSAFFRSLYLEGRRGEEGERVEGLLSQKWRKFKLGAEEKDETPLLLKFRNGILSLKVKQGIDKHKLEKLENGEGNKVLYGEKPIDKTSFEISKAMNKKLLKEKRS